jgi:hypothetical protein
MTTHKYKKNPCQGKNGNAVGTGKHMATGTISIMAAATLYPLRFHKVLK